MTDYVTISKAEIVQIVNQLETMNVSIAQSTDELRALLNKAPSVEPIGHLNGLDMLADYMSMELRKHHEEKNSHTPKDFTIPVYTSPPQAELEARIAELEKDARRYRWLKTQMQLHFHSETSDFIWNCDMESSEVDENIDDAMENQNE